VIEVKFLRRRKVPDGSHQLFQDSVRYAITHRVEVWGQREAASLADSLHGRFEASIVPSPFDTLAAGLWEVTLTHTGVPDQRTVPRARKAIEEAIQEAGVRGRYLNFERTELGPADPPRRHPFADKADDDGEDDGENSVFSMPLPLKS
jgi:hypothetical protein